MSALTGRELEIAELIVDRKTNAEIARELFLSKKTVETHIRNMFRKLDANSRVDIARAMEAAERGVRGSTVPRCLLFSFGVTRARKDSCTEALTFSSVCAEPGGRCGLLARCPIARKWRRRGRWQRGSAEE